MHIMALHGFTGRGCDFEFISNLIGGVWHCPDMPGHGPNPQMDCSPEATIRFIENEIFQADYNNLKGIKVLLGYSMGARAAMQHVLTNTSAWDAVILISPQPGIENKCERISRQDRDTIIENRILREGARKFIEFWQQTDLIKSQNIIASELRSVMQNARYEHTSQGLATSLREFGQGRCPNLWPKVKDLALPTLIITGSEDTLYTEIARSIIKINTSIYKEVKLQLAVIKNAGHAPHLERPEITATKILKFLEQIGR